MHRSKGPPVLSSGGCQNTIRRALGDRNRRRKLPRTYPAGVLWVASAGYSRLRGVDEEGTHVELKGHLRTLVEPKTAEHRGRVVKNTGDGMLAEFSSVVDVLRCAVEFQRGIAARNAEVLQDKRIQFRVGINVGVIEKNDICVLAIAITLDVRP